MAPNDILEKLRREPFQPLRVHVSDGSSYDIPEPGIASLNVTEMYIGVDPDDTGVPKRSVYFDTRHITRIEPLPQSSQSQGNGRQ